MCLEYAAALCFAKDLIASFVSGTYGAEPDFSDLAHVPLAYAPTPDGMHEIQAYANLISDSPSLDIFVDGELVENFVYKSLEFLIAAELVYLSHGLLTGVSPKIEKYLEKLNQEELPCPIGLILSHPSPAHLD